MSMPTPLLIFFVFLSLAVQVAFQTMGAGALWSNIAFTLGLNFGIALLMYAAVWRYKNEPVLVRGIEKSTKQGLIGIAIIGAVSIAFGALLGFGLNPLLHETPPKMDWTLARGMWPTFVFIDAISVLYQRWRDNRKVEQTNQRVNT